MEYTYIFTFLFLLQGNSTRFYVTQNEYVLKSAQEFLLCSKPQRMMDVNLKS